MTDMTAFIGHLIRQALILVAIVGITFAAGVNWAEAATPQSSIGAPSALQAMVLFMATIGLFLHLKVRSQERVRVRVRARRRDTRR